MGRILHFQPICVSPWLHEAGAIGDGSELARPRNASTSKTQTLYTFINTDSGAQYPGLNAEEVIELWCIDRRTYITISLDGLIDLRTANGDGIYLTIAGDSLCSRRYTFDDAAQALASDGDGVEIDRTTVSRSDALDQSYASGQQDFLVTSIELAAGYLKGREILEVAQDRMNLMAAILERNNLEPQTGPSVQALLSLKALQALELTQQDGDAAAVIERHNQEIVKFGQRHGHPVTRKSLRPSP